MEIFDITPTISPSLAVFPGDKKFSRNVSFDMKQGDHLTLSSVETTLHLGAHTDAESHYSVNGKSIDEHDLQKYIGPCQVIEDSLIKFKKFPIKAPRVLFKTNSFLDPNNWRDDFSYLTEEIVEYLKSQNVELIGIDTPSVDPASSKNLSAHNKIYQSKIYILEGIVLEDIEPGLYNLIALPLKIKDGDASPVRAILTRE